MLDLAFDALERRDQQTLAKAKLCLAYAAAKPEHRQFLGDSITERLVILIRGLS